MTVVFVHGNPETPIIWGPLLDALGRTDVVTLSPPGFGTPAPAEFEGTADAYLAWLVSALNGISPPIDLVGHDWGGLHVMRVASTRPDLIRSWCSDGVGALDPRYVWHDLAQLWQSPGEGEVAVEALIASSLVDKTKGLVSRGMSIEAAHACAAGLDPSWGRCILRLSRSAVQPRMVEWGKLLDKAERRPALAIVPKLDLLAGGEQLARRSAVRFGAGCAILPGVGHMWMMEDPALGAAALRAFFDRL